MPDSQDNIIGVIGGMGPYAGLDLIEKIFSQTDAHSDQEHLPVALLSYPGLIDDRAQYLFGKSTSNPADAIAGIALQLDRLGAVVAGMPCNTAHAPAIFDRIVQQLEKSGARLRLLNMIDETVDFLANHRPEARRVGIMSTQATYRLRLYSDRLEKAGLGVVLLEDGVHDELVSQSIYDPEYGIKSCSSPVHPVARQNLLAAIGRLAENGAEAIILGCTELPLAVPEAEINGIPLIDPARVLARALILSTYPERLRPIEEAADAA
jgi:aspartate racemase